MLLTRLCGHAESLPGRRLLTHSLKESQFEVLDHQRSHQRQLWNLASSQENSPTSQLPTDLNHVAKPDISISSLRPNPSDLWQSPWHKDLLRKPWTYSVVRWR